MKGRVARIPESVKLVVPWLAFLVLFILPLYLITATILIRMDFFKFDNKTLGDEQIKALWAFVATGLGTAATITGALLTYQHNRRTQAIQSQADELKAQREEEATARADKAQQEKQRLDEQAAARMTLEIVVKGLELITEEGGYAPHARVAGALVTMVQLNQEIIAMRILSVLWKDHRVDNDTATWLIGKVLTIRGDSGSAEEAATLLYLHAGELADKENRGFYSWPALPNDWATELPSQLKQLLLLSTVRLLVSQDRSWWDDEGDHRWAYSVLTQALNGPDDDASTGAALIMKPLLEDYRQYGFDDVQDVENRVAELTKDLDDIPKVYRDQVGALRKWYSDGVAQVQAPINTNIPSITDITPSSSTGPGGSRS
jgi:hypothetical protein